MDKKVVILATSLYKIGGDLTSTLRMANAIADDYDVEVVNFAKRKDIKFDLHPNITVKNIPMFYHYEQFPEEMWNGNILKLLWFPFLILRWIYFFFINRYIARIKVRRRYKNDVIWAYNYMGYLLCPKKRAIFHMHFSHERILGFTEPLLFKTFGKPKAIVALTKTCQESFTNKFKKFKTYYLPNTLDTIEKYPIKHNGNKLIFMGRFCAQKNIKNVIRVAHELDKLDVDFTMDLYGNAKGEGKGEKKLIKKLKLTDKVFLQGKTTEPRKVMHEHDVLVLASRFEGGYLNVVLEAIASGCTVATTRWSTSVDELYKDKCITGEDVKDLANNLAPYLKDKKKLLEKKKQSQSIMDTYNKDQRKLWFDDIYNDFITLPKKYKK